MSASQNNLSLLLQTLDALNAVVLDRQLPPYQFAGVVGAQSIGNLPDAAAHAIALPTAEVLQFVLRNQHATAKVTVTWTPSGGGAGVAKTIGPGGILVFWEIGAGSGISTLQLQSDTANTPYEIFLGG